MADLLDLVFTSGRSFGNWLDRPVEPALLRRTYELVRHAPTSVNCQPGRFVFVSSPEAKARLLPAMTKNNFDKVRTAPVTVIVAADSRYYEHLPRLFHHRPEVGAEHEANPAMARETAFRNSTLQGGYFILAARSLGLDCGPMSGFDAAAVDAEFFPDERWRSNFLINVGYGDRSTLFPPLPRLDFEEACRFF